MNYDAIDVESVNKIPCDYEGEMGVPISIFDKLDTDQFELVGIMSNPETLPGIRVIGQSGLIYIEVRRDWTYHCEHEISGWH